METLTKENLCNLPGACHVAVSHRGDSHPGQPLVFNKVLKMTEHLGIRIFFY